MNRTRTKDHTAAKQVGWGWGTGDRGCSLGTQRSVAGSQNLDFSVLDSPGSRRQSGRDCSAGGRDCSGGSGLPFALPQTLPEVEAHTVLDGCWVKALSCSAGGSGSVAVEFSMALIHHSGLQGGLLAGRDGVGMSPGSQSDRRCGPCDSSKFYALFLLGFFEVFLRGLV